MMKRKDLDDKKPTIAPGMDDQEELDQSADQKDVAKGEFTKVTTLSFDEVDPSEEKRRPENNTPPH